MYTNELYSYLTDPWKRVGVSTWDHIKNNTPWAIIDDHINGYELNNQIKYDEAERKRDARINAQIEAERQKSSAKYSN